MQLLQLVPKKEVKCCVLPSNTENSILALLTESEKNEIKRKIGERLFEYLKQATIRIIL